MKSEFRKGDIIVRIGDTTKLLVCGVYNQMYDLKTFGSKQCVAFMRRLVDVDHVKVGHLDDERFW